MCELITTCISLSSMVEDHGVDLREFNQEVHDSFGDTEYFNSSLKYSKSSLMNVETAPDHRKTGQG